ncbi:MAG TPA: RHS repeat-associated core domain-containing protein [Thermomicrobiales bacterium]|nr:RHS repeat-associated core domain-containing protein [Thermomicrobiales bacterium]
MARESFGSALSSSGVSSTFGFTGELTDPTTGFVHLRARDYNPATGRFVSMDTVQPNAPGTQGYNRCAYVANNPARWTDPSGHSVGDVATLLGPIGMLVGQMQALVTLTLMPATRGNATEYHSRTARPCGRGSR